MPTCTRSPRAGTLRAEVAVLGGLAQYQSRPRDAGLTDNLGFDPLSIYPDKRRRLLEVKNRANTGDMEVASNEWPRAANLHDGYWLYAVYDCATPAPRLVRV